MIFKKKKMLLAGLITLFVTTFSLFYIFDKVEELQHACETDQGLSLICREMNGYSLSSIAILVAVGTVVLVIIATVYMLLSSAH